MKVLKIIGTVLLVLACFAVCAFFVQFLYRGVAPAQQTEPEIDDVQLLFPEEEEEQTQEYETETEQTDEHIPAEQLAEEYLQDMTLEEKIWQMFFLSADSLVGVNATQAGELTQEALQQMPVGGLCYFANNLIDPQQTTDLLLGTQDMAKTPLFLATDEEGGQVSRLGSNPEMGVIAMQPAAVYGAGDVLLLRQDTQQLAADMVRLGFNMNFAPVTDVLLDANNTEIGDRSYSELAGVCAVMSGTMAETLQSGGIVACLKHFPGHGAAVNNSHDGKSICNRTAEQLQAEEWIAFQSGIEKGVHFVMMSHLTNENFSEHPASLSPEIVQMLRKDLDFDGVIITDALNMGAITAFYTSGDAAVMAVKAGCDMLLMPNDALLAYEAVLTAVQDGDIPEEQINDSVLRILTVKYEMGIMQ